jgi:hypothetical protein
MLFRRWYRTCSRVESGQPVAYVDQFLTHIACPVEQRAVNETGTSDGTFKIRQLDLKVRHQLCETFDWVVVPLAAASWSRCWRRVLEWGPHCPKRRVLLSSPTCFSGLVA